MFEDSVIEISGSEYLLTQRHIAGERNPQLHSSKALHSQNKKIRNAENVGVLTASARFLFTALFIEHFQ